MSTLEQNLARLQTAKTAIANAITEKGGTVNQGDGFEEFPDDISSIPSGSDTSGACLTFKGTASFTLKTYNTSKNWDGTLAYSTDGSTWSTWDGVTIISSSSTEPYVLYLRGTGNTYITGSDYTKRFTFTTTGTIDCIGRIDTLLDYKTVQNGGAPTMGDCCYYGLFRECSLTTAPALPATTLTNSCYSGMFSRCTKLVCPPGILPAITLANSCYSYMFQDCTSLTTVPTLPATTLTNSCYRGMFTGCISLTTAPALPATTLASSCYNRMFDNCTSLTTAPALPATNLAEYCYAHMFDYCKSLTSIPALPATTLADYCYSNMFNDCTALKLSKTRDSIIYTKAYRIPTSGTGGGSALSPFSDMFSGTGGTFTGPPGINTTYYLHKDNIII